MWIFCGRWLVWVTTVLGRGLGRLAGRWPFMTTNDDCARRRFRCLRRRDVVTELIPPRLIDSTLIVLRACKPFTVNVSTLNDVLLWRQLHLRIVLHGDESRSLIDNHTFVHHHTWLNFSPLMWYLRNTSTAFADRRFDANNTVPAR